MPLMRSRRRLSLAGLAALAAMLFAQAAFALAACDLYQSRAQMLAEPDEASCHESQKNAKLCLAHCQSGDQALDKHQVKIPEAESQPVLVLPRLQAVRPQVCVPAHAPCPAAGPPLRILFRSFLI